jgi:signal peptidase II
MRDLFHPTRVLFLSVAILCAALDLVSKELMFLSIKPGDHVVVVPGYFRLDRALNTGGMWSIGASHPMMNHGLGVFAGLVAFGLAWWAMRHLKPGQHGAALVFGMLLGGAIGNLHDRWVYAGVRDFITVHYRDVYYWPTFNLADSFLVVGAGIILFHSIFGPNPPEPSPTTTPATVSTP